MQRTEVADILRLRVVREELSTEIICGSGSATVQANSTTVTGDN